MEIDLGLQKLTCVLPENLARQKVLLSPSISQSLIDEKYPLLSFGITTPSLGFCSAHGCPSRDNVIEWKWCVQPLGHVLKSDLLSLFLSPLGKWWWLGQTLWHSGRSLCGGWLSHSTSLDTREDLWSRAPHGPALPTYFWPLREKHTPVSFKPLNFQVSVTVA